MKTKVKKTIAKAKPEAPEATKPAATKPEATKPAATSPAQKPVAVPKQKAVAAAKHAPGLKKKKKEAVPATPVSEAEKAKLMKAAIADILKGIADPAEQKNGAAYIPKDWHIEYRNALGPYKKFVQSQPDTFTVVDRPHGNFIILKAGEPVPASMGKVSASKNWQQVLQSAWSCYHTTVPAGEQSLDNFLIIVKPKPPAEKGAEDAAAATGKRKEPEADGVEGPKKGKKAKKGKA